MSFSWTSRFDFSGDVVSSFSCMGGSRKAVGCSKSRVEQHQIGGPAWKSDDSTDCCENCGMLFNLFVRRHHCRYCGKIFCNVCTATKRRLVVFGYVTACRVCMKCNTVVSRAEELSESVMLNHQGYVKQLLKEKRASVNCYTGLFPPLTIAAKNGHTEIVQMLLKAGADVGLSVPPCTPPAYECAICGKTTPIHADLKNDDPAMLACGACNQKPAVFDVTSMDHTGFTALHCAAKKTGNEKTVRMLLKYQADIESVSNTGMTPLMLAVEAKQHKNAEVLLESGADPNAVNKRDGETALHKAVRGGNPYCITSLLGTPLPDGKLVDLFIRNHKALTARQLAKELGLGEIANMLQDAEETVSKEEISRAQPERTATKEVVPDDPRSKWLASSKGAINQVIADNQAKWAQIKEEKEQADWKARQEQIKNERARVAVIHQASEYEQDQDNDATEPVPQENGTTHDDPDI